MWLFYAQQFAFSSAEFAQNFQQAVLLKQYSLKNCLVPNFKGNNPFTQSFSKNLSWNTCCVLDAKNTKMSKNHRKDVLGGHI